MSAAERLKGAEELMTALYESLTTDGYSFGRVCYRLCELAGLDMTTSPVRSTLHYAGGLTVNNFLCGGMRDMDANGQNLGGAERSREDVLRAEVERLVRENTRLAGLVLEAAKLIQQNMAVMKNKADIIDELWAVAHGGAT